MERRLVREIDLSEKLEAHDLIFAIYLCRPIERDAIGNQVPPHKHFPCALFNLINSIVIFFLLLGLTQLISPESTITTTMIKNSPIKKLFWAFPQRKALADNDLLSNASSFHRREKLYAPWMSEFKVLSRRFNLNGWFRDISCAGLIWIYPRAQLLSLISKISLGEVIRSLCVYLFNQRKALVLKLPLLLSTRIAQDKRRVTWHSAPEVDDRDKASASISV